MLNLFKNYTYNLVFYYSILVNTFSAIFCILCGNDENLVPQ